MSNPWTYDIVQTLRVLRKQQGLSASQCAKSLNAMYKTSFTRNAVIGKLIRSGIVTPAPLGSRRHSERAKPRRLKKPKAMVHFGDPVAAKPTQTVKIDARVSRSLPPHPINDAGAFATVLTVTSAMCVYPIGDPKDADFAFCGRARSHGAYCQAHGALCYRPNEKRRAA